MIEYIKFDANGNFIATWTSYDIRNKQGKFESPNGIAIDSLDNVYIVDSHQPNIKNFDHIKKFDSNGNFITKWGNNGTGNGEFDRPEDIAVDSQDNVYVAEWGNNRIQKFDSNGNFITKWGTEGIGDGQFAYPIGIGIDSSDSVYVAEWGNNRIQKFDSNGNFITKWEGYPITKLLGDGQFNHPSGIALDSQDNVYVAEWGDNSIQKFDSNGNFINIFGSKGRADGQFNHPSGIAIDSKDNVYVVDRGNDRIQVFAPTK